MRRFSRRTVFRVRTLILVLFLAFAVWHGLEGQTVQLGEMPNLLDTKLHRGISLDLRDMDVVDVYRFLALRGDFNTSISRHISGRVTLYLKNVTIRDALDIISLSNDLAYKIVGENIVHVMTEAEYQAVYGRRFSDRREVRIIRLNYVKPAYALEALSNLKSDVGRVVIDEDTGSVVLIDTPSNIQRMTGVIDKMDQRLQMKVFDLQYADVDDVVAKLRKEIDNRAVGTTEGDRRSNQVIVRAFPDRLSDVEKMIEALDRKTKAVLIDVRILKIVLNPQYRRGIDWKNFMANAGNIALAGTLPHGHFLGRFVMDEHRTLGLGRIGAEGITVGLEMLDEVSSTKVLANPRLLVTENEEARIHIGDKLAYITTQTIGTGDAQQVNEHVHYLNVGVQFAVSTRINEDGFVTMNIRPEISSQSGILKTPQGSEIPLINTTSLETEVIVQDKHTIVMAGLKQNENIKGEVGISGLKDIPFFGRVFQRETYTETMTEIAILITPHIVTGEEHHSDEQYLKRTIITEYKDY